MKTPSERGWMAMKCLQLGTAMPEICVSCLNRVADNAGIQGPSPPAFMGCWALPKWGAEEKALTPGIQASLCWCCKQQAFN